jgi:hypothetical protein
MNKRSASHIALLAPIMAVALCGCATHTQRYAWGNYDPSLYAYYKDPAKEAALEQSLTASISAADSHQGQVPPGIYAEYGYLQLQQGKNAVAVEFFNKEKAQWPESTVFMDRMIKVASTSSPASASE